MSDAIHIRCDPGALAILRQLRDAGHETFFVGGCVRDALMGRCPKDWDIATAALPENVEALFPRTIPVGKQFGVILVVHEGEEYEVATFRGDGNYSDGRRPDSVRFSNAEEDVKRRDFTINALLYDPDSESVVDYVGGQRDLEAGILRTVGDPRERFLEDHLRMLRAVRFAARTGFTPAPETLAAIAELAGLVIAVSAERRGEELTRMLTEGYAARAFSLLRTTGLMPHVLPHVARMAGVPQPPRFHPEGDVWEHTRLMLEMLDRTVTRSLQCTAPAADGQQHPTVLEDAMEGQPPTLLFPDGSDREILAWSVLLHDVGKPETISYSDRIRFNCHDSRSAELAREILADLRRPGRITDAVVEVVGRHMRFCHMRDMREAKRRRFAQNPRFPLHLELHRLDCLASHSKLDQYTFALDAWLEERERPEDQTPLLNGRDLMAMGYEPGPAMGNILRALQDARLEGMFSTPDAARTWVRQHYPETAIE